MRRAIGALAVAATLAAGFIATPAAGHDYPCMIKPLMRATLAAKYGEARAFTGSLGQSNAAEIWIDDADGSWTLIAITPDGRACPLASGEGWEVAPPIPATAREG